LKAIESEELDQAQFGRVGGVAVGRLLTRQEALFRLLGSNFAH
jgi:hypothetical protein